MQTCKPGFIRTLLAVFTLCCFLGSAVWAQNTAFTYQSRLNDNGALANGNYDLQFSLFDALNGGAQIGDTLNKSGVAIANGVFIVQLDFGTNAFSNGGQRFLQIAVRPAGTSDPYTTLSPRTEITSTPYAIRSLSAATADNATQLNGVAAGDYVKTDDGRLSDARDPKPGSTSYIQNGTAPQSGDFNISGNGAVGGTLTANLAGVGTTAPEDRLHVNGFSAGVRVSDGPVATRLSSHIQLGGFVGTVTNHPFALRTNDLNRLLITNSGSVGIGVPLPFDKLHVGGTGAALRVSDGQIHTRLYADQENQIAMVGTVTNNAFSVRTSNVDRIYIGSNGNVGIGTDTPASRLAVVGDSSFQGLLKVDGTASTPGKLNVIGDGSFSGTLTTNRLTVNDTVSAKIFNTSTQYNLEGQRLIGTRGYANLFVGVGAGLASGDSSFGNAFFGRDTGKSNVTGQDNSYFGRETGINSLGNGNSFFGASAGRGNIGGAGNTLIGVSTNVGVNNLLNATAIGAQAFVSQNNSLVLGSIAGINGATVSTNVGIGTTAPTERLHVVGNALFTGGLSASGTSTFDNDLGITGNANIGGNVGIGTTAPAQKLHVANGNIRWGNSLLTPDQGGSIELGNPNATTLLTPYIDFHYRAPSMLTGRDFAVRLINDDPGRLNVIGSFNATVNISAAGKISANSGFNGRCLNGSIGSSSFNGSSGSACNMDLAESFRTLQRTEPGDVVTLLTQDRDKPTVRKTRTAYDAQLIGVVSTNPGLIFDEGQTHLSGDNTQLITKDKTAVAMVGRVPVKFTLENGAINVGDALTSSATEPGKAMKATSAGKIIGIALESSDKAKDGKLLMWLQVGHHEPTNTTIANRNLSRKRQAAAMTALKRENATLQQQLHTVLGQLKTVGTRLDELERAATQTNADARDH